jgi:Spy/CpxP family protein refolding chaperone
MTKRRWLGVAAAALSASACVAAMAWAGESAGDEPRAMRRAGRGGAALAEYLGLTEQQKTAWRALQEERREAMKPVAEEGLALRKKLREAVEAPSPDPTAVGEAALALEAHHKKVRAEREAFQQKIEAVLDPAQKEKLKAFEAARRTLGAGRDGHRGPRPGRRAEGAGRIERQ